jgi:hypothetical protein
MIKNRFECSKINLCFQRKGSMFISIYAQGCESEKFRSISGCMIPKNPIGFPAKTISAQRPSKYVESKKSSTVLNSNTIIYRSFLGYNMNKLQTLKKGR